MIPVPNMERATGNRAPRPLLNLTAPELRELDREYPRDKLPGSALFSALAGRLAPKSKVRGLTRRAVRSAYEQAGIPFE